MAKQTSHLEVWTHCLPLVSMVFLANFMTDKWTDIYSDRSLNLFKLSTILCINYVLLTLIVNKIKVNYNNLLITLVITSLVFGYLFDSILFLDSFICLTLWMFLSNFCYILLNLKLWPILKSSFSMGEFFIISQLSMTYLSSSSACILTKLSDSTMSQLFCANNTPNLVLQIIFFGIALIVILELILYKRMERSGHVFDIIIISSVIFSIYCLLFSELHMNPIIWLKEFMFCENKRTNLLINWGITLTTAIIFTTYYTIKSKSKANTITRKVFHIFISIVYLFGFKSDLYFLSFSSASILAVFVVIEIIRIRRIPPFCDQIESAFDRFRDEKDSGILTLTHIYLLIGFSLPIWLSPSFERKNFLVMASGLITVGFGDTAASIGGTLLGKHQWNNSRKTYEGTVCAIIVQIIICLLFIELISVQNSINLYSLLMITIISFITALIESNIKEVDNLVLPLYHYILVKILL